MDTQSVERWFSGYLAEFIAAGRGESQDVQGLIRHDDVPLLTKKDAACGTLDAAPVLGLTQQQVDELRSAHYDRSQQR